MIKRDICPACKEYKTLCLTLTDGRINGTCSDCGAVFRVYPRNMINLDIDLILQLFREKAFKDIKVINPDDSKGFRSIQDFISFIDLIEQIFSAPTGVNAEYKVFQITKKEETENDRQTD